MINPKALSALVTYLEDEHGEDQPLQTNDEVLPGLVKYTGITEFLGDMEGSSIHSLITLANHKGKENWIAYMVSKLDDHSIAGIVHHSSLGEHVDDEAQVEAILWIGEGEIPKEVEKAMRAYHAREVGSDYATRISVMRYSLEEVAEFMPADSRARLATSITELMRTNLI